MDLAAIIADKTLKPKEQTECISRGILAGTVAVQSLIEAAAGAKDTVKGTCIEELEYATKLRPELADTVGLEWAISLLTEKAPRIKWEAAKVIGNIAHRFPDALDQAVVNLLAHTEHTGTVVRWSAAFALGEIVVLPHPRSEALAGAIEVLIEREEKNSIRKMYLAALKKRKREN